MRREGFEPNIPLARQSHALRPPPLSRALEGTSGFLQPQSNSRGAFVETLAKLNGNSISGYKTEEPIGDSQICLDVHHSLHFDALFFAFFL